MADIILGGREPDPGEEAGCLGDRLYDAVVTGRIEQLGRYQTDQFGPAAREVVERGGIAIRYTCRVEGCIASADISSRVSDDRVVTDEFVIAGSAKRVIDTNPRTTLCRNSALNPGQQRSRIVE